MNKRKTTGANCGSKNASDYFANNQRLFSLDCAVKTGELQSVLAEHLAQHKRVIRLFRCFCCEKNCTALKMSNCLAVCRECYNTAQSKGAIGKRNFVEKTLNNLHKFLRRRVAL
jgi:hypothetical protein